MNLPLEKLQFPLGSMIVDGALVLALFYNGGQLTERLENMDRRLASVEVTTATDKLSQRTAMLEQTVQERGATIERNRKDMMDALERISDKLDTKVDRER